MSAPESPISPPTLSGAVPAAALDTHEVEEAFKRLVERCRSPSSTASTFEGASRSDEIIDDDLSETTEWEADAQAELLDSILDGAEASSSDAVEVSSEVADPVERRGFGALVAATVLCGCACQAPYEVLNSRDKGCGSLMAFVEHIFGIVASLGALRQPRQLPWSLHLSLAALNAGYTLLISAAFSTSLSTTVLVAMKNGNLVASMLLGILVLRHRYSPRQYVGVLVLSAGLVVTSLCGMRSSSTSSAGAAAQHADAGLGVLYLVGALLCRSATGLLQEVCGHSYRASISELLFYRSALGLPLILVKWPVIYRHFQRWSLGTSVSGLVFPVPWLLLAANIVFDYGMKVCITRLIERRSSSSPPWS